MSCIKMPNSNIRMSENTCLVNFEPLKTEKKTYLCIATEFMFISNPVLHVTIEEVFLSPRIQKAFHCLYYLKVGVCSLPFVLKKKHVRLHLCNFICLEVFLFFLDNVLNLIITCLFFFSLAYKNERQINNLERQIRFANATNISLTKFLGR